MEENKTTNLYLLLDRLKDTINTPFKSIEYQNTGILRDAKIKDLK